MARTKNTQTVRLNFQVSVEVRDRLLRLQEASGADTLTEVVKRALATYDLLLKRSKEGFEIILRQEDGEERALDLPEAKAQWT